MPPSRSPAMNVIVFQCPNGTASRQRSPTGTQPWSRAIFVLTPVSSRKTRLTGAMNGCAAFHSLRLWPRPADPARRRAGLFLKDSPSRCTAFHVAPVLKRTPYSARSQVCAYASVIPGRERMWVASASSGMPQSLGGLWPRFGLTPASPVRPTSGRGIARFDIS